MKQKKHSTEEIIRILRQADGDQGDRISEGATKGGGVHLQLVVEDAPEIGGWSATIEFDPLQVGYVGGSFQASGFIPGLVALVDEKESSVGIGGTVLGTGANSSGNAVLGSLSFELLEGFTGETELIISALTFNRSDGEREKPEVRALGIITIEEETNALQGDFDGSGTVDFNDFFIFADAFGGTEPSVDLNDDGTVDFNDFFIFADNFGREGQAKLIALAQDLIGLPRTPHLEQNYPNPFNSRTVIGFNLPQDANVVLAVYDLVGKKVCTLVEGDKASGAYAIEWDGIDGDSRKVASGVYILRLQALGQLETRKMMLIR